MTLLCLGATLYAISGMVMTASFAGSTNADQWEKNFYVWMGVAAVSLCGSIAGMFFLTGKRKSGRE